MFKSINQDDSSSILMIIMLPMKQWFDKLQFIGPLEGGENTGNNLCKDWGMRNSISDVKLHKSECVHQDCCYKINLWTGRGLTMGQAGGVEITGFIFVTIFLN